VAFAPGVSAYLLPLAPPPPENPPPKLLPDDDDDDPELVPPPISQPEDPRPVRRTLLPSMSRTILDFGSSPVSPGRGSDGQDTEQKGGYVEERDQRHRERNSAEPAAPNQREEGLRAKPGPDHERTEADEYPKEWDRQISRRPAALLERASLARRQHVVAPDDVGDVRYAGANAAGVVVIAEFRQKVLAGDRSPIL
jgi:hypothetical protein